MVKASLWILLSRRHFSSFSHTFGTSFSTVKFAANHYRLRGFATCPIPIPELIFAKRLKKSVSLRQNLTTSLEIRLRSKFSGFRDRVRRVLRHAEHRKSVKGYLS